MITESSTWREGALLPHFPSLGEDISVDVAIVGGGITGITTAYLLSKAGFKVALLEKDRLTHGATIVTTAFLCKSIDTSASDLIPMFGEENARTIISSHSEAIDSVEDIIMEENISCDFERCSNFIYASSENEMNDLQEELKATKTLGVSIQFSQDAKLGFPNTGYLEVFSQAKFHPLKYLAHLVTVLSKQGVQIFEHTEVQKLEHGPEVILTTNTFNVQAKHVFFATYAPFQRELFFKKATYTTYVLEVELEKNRLAEGTYENIQSPYHYFRVDRNGEKDRMIIGGEDHRSDIPANPEKNFQALENFTKELLDSIPYTITKRWKGPIMESIDGLAWIGSHGHDNVFYATGFSGNGMTYSMIAARMITDAIQGKNNPWKEIYRTERIPTLKQLQVKGRDYTKKLIGGAVKNFFVRAK